MPITLGLLIDTSASMDRMIDAEQDAASRFLREVMRPKDEAMVITFDFDVDLLADFTQDTSVLSSAIRRARVNSVGGGGVVTPGTIPAGQRPAARILYDAIYLACHDRTRHRSGPQGRDHPHRRGRYRKQIAPAGRDGGGAALRRRDSRAADRRSHGATFGIGPAWRARWRKTPADA